MASLQTQKQSFTEARERGLPRYGDDEKRFMKGKHYIYRKKKGDEEPAPNSRAIKSFWRIAEARTWARSNCMFDWCIVSKV